MSSGTSDGSIRSPGPAVLWASQSARSDQSLGEPCRDYILGADREGNERTCHILGQMIVGTNFCHKRRQKRGL